MGRPPQLALLWLGLVLAAAARQLPIRVYTTADGLPHNRANCIVQDTRGFLWFCTGFGLSRFDGYRFTNYGPEHGLPDRAATAFLETRKGAYWVGTADGLYLLRSRPGSGSRFERFPFGAGRESQQINALLEDKAGRLWVGTEAGLYQLEGANMRPISVGTNNGAIYSLIEDRRGAVWIGMATGLYRRAPDGSIQRYTQKDGLVVNVISSLLEDRQGRIWAGSLYGGIAILAYDAANQAKVTQTYTTRNGLPVGRVTDLLESDDGAVWIGTAYGLCEWRPGAALRVYSNLNGLIEASISALGQDREGNLWASTESSGTMKITRGGFVRYNERDGLGHTRIRALLENERGELTVISHQILINRFDGGRFKSIRPNTPGTITNLGWGWNQTVLEDHTGEWWIPTGQGLLRFSKPRKLEQLARASPKALYTSRNGLPRDEIFRLFEDSRGDVWISVLGDPPRLVRWERATDSFHAFGEAAGIPDRMGSPLAFAEDRAGDLWIGLYGGVARQRDGRFRVFEPGDGAPSGIIRDFHVDGSGRLWMASSRGGLAYIDNPAAERPGIIAVTTGQGLSSNFATCLTEDRWARIYAGTARGIDRVELRAPNVVLVRHYTTYDGLVHGECTCALRDHNGMLWFGTLQGLAALDPEPDRPGPSPPVWIGGMRVRGKPRVVSDLGETDIGGLMMKSFENDLAIDYFGISFRAGEVLRFEYMLEGADRDWSAPTDQRTVNYASLSPGRYRFRVRAIDSQGTVSEKAASAAFQVLPPLWSRWWMQTLAAALLGALLYSVYQYRVARLLELERIRTRIAADLHDEIGSSLSQMAILSEVTREEIRSGSGGALDTAGQIAETARTMVDAMSDIVWSIDPRRDDLTSLLERVRRFASDVLEARGIAWSFETPPSLGRVKLTPEQRRQVYLILKEALHNAARHAGAQAVTLRIAVADRRLTAEVQDNGRGFAANGASPPQRGGYGLESMRARAEQLRGRLEISSSPGAGTRISLGVPL